MYTVIHLYGWNIMQTYIVCKTAVLSGVATEAHHQVGGNWRPLQVCKWHKIQRRHVCADITTLYNHLYIHGCLFTTHTHTHYVGCPRGVEYIPHSIRNAHCSVPQWYSSARLRTTWVPMLAPIPCNNNYLPLSSCSTFSLSSNSSRKWFPGTWGAHTWSFCVGCRQWRVEWHKQSGEIPWWTHRLEPNDSVTSRRE